MQSLQNHFIIATPDMDDPAFKRTVTYICEHNEEGAMGLVINQPADVAVNHLLQQLEIVYPEQSQLLQAPVYSGGPVARDRGFVLHPPQDNWRSSLRMSDDIMVTTSRDILEALGSSAAPHQFILTLGYAGWEAGQLEQEIADAITTGNINISGDDCSDPYFICTKKNNITYNNLQWVWDQLK